ncbi:MAG TPA: NAD-dependent protein deacetylase [Kineosporiaceae bacterium]|nr:NAD-dependent protein deacetylase [Kineosporiaceae bacterium]
MDVVSPTVSPTASPTQALADLIARGGVVVLSGAGLSTESGIPDYRGPSGALRKHVPMTYQAFTDDPAARHRYWARSYLGWRQMAGARPNAGHHGVAALQQAGLISGIVTQNVDGLHQAAGATGVIELHGGLDRVICRNCDHVVDRAQLDRDLRAANPTFAAAGSRINPDGDAELSDDALAGFVMVDCESCGGGPLKPDVVFFGETVPRDRVEHCFDLVDRADSLLVLGSSLKVMSGFRFVLRAAKRGIPVAIVNQGPTRGDGYCSVRVDAPLGAVLSTMLQQLG